MKLRSGRYKWLTPPMSINEILPNEMLEAILLKLPTRDLLNCRSVSKLWKAFASYICRRRYVDARLWRGFCYDLTEAFFDTFQNTSDLPWSACSLIIGKDMRTEPLNLEQLKRFLDTFGPNIRKLNLNRDSSLDRIMPAIVQMPNLEILVSEIDIWAQDVQKACSGNGLEFSKLKHLEITVSSEADIQLIEFICTNARKLKSILVTFDDKEECFDSVEQADWRRLIGSISRIPSIALNFYYICTTWELFQTLTVPELKVKEVRLEFSEIDVGEQYYRALEQFLAGNSKCLEKLKMKDYSRRTAGPLRIPFLSKLKELALKLRNVSSATCHVEPFNSNQFPNLRKVSVRIPKKERVNGIRIFETAQFDSVQKLILHSSAERTNAMTTDWNRIFPNLVTLDMDSVTVGSYPYIYQRMSHLEHLYLTGFYVRQPVVADNSPHKPVYRGDSNSILCQYPKVTKKKTRETAQTPSLSSLTNLKTLTLNFLGCEIPDSKVHLALLKLHPLECLTFRNIEISSAVKEKLSQFHGNVEVEPKFGNHWY